MEQVSHLGFTGCLWLLFKHSSFSVGTNRDRSQRVPATIQPPFEEFYPKKFPPWGFFQTNLHPAVISVLRILLSGFVLPQTGAFSSREEVVGLCLDPGRGGRARAAPLTLSSSFSTQPFTLCALCSSSVSLRVQLHDPFSPLAAGCHPPFLLVPPFHPHPCGLYSSVQDMGASLLKRGRKPWALGTDLVSNPSSFIF